MAGDGACRGLNGEQESLLHILLMLTGVLFFLTVRRMENLNALAAFTQI